MYTFSQWYHTNMAIIIAIKTLILPLSVMIYLWPQNLIQFWSKNKPVVILTLLPLAPRKEATTTNFKVFGLTRLGIEPTTSHSTGRHSTKPEELFNLPENYLSEKHWTQFLSGLRLFYNDFIFTFLVLYFGTTWFSFLPAILTN